ncbi:MAG TPA: alpha/beta fold hydrolase, partial [Dermatophilaceae bacterium]|nr:alpha/beta fold hydrolase [Dermatophilaceae bacterium]
DATVTHLAAVTRLRLWTHGARVEVERYLPHHLEPGQPQVVFLHGWGMSHAGYRTSLQLIAIRGARVDAYALPGYSGSTPLPVRACGLTDHARRVAAALEQAAYDGPVHVVGHSFGGGIALSVAATRPDLVDRVTAVCPIGGAGQGPTPWPHLVRTFLTDGGTAGLTGFVRSFAPAARRSPLTLAATGLAARRADLTAELAAAKRHNVPVHLVLADRDTVVPPGPMVHPVFGARLSMVRGSHSWPHQDPRGFADRVLCE